MLVALTWWGWSGLVASVGAILGVWARHAWRAAVRQELVDYLAHAAPEIEVAGARGAALVYRTAAAGVDRRFCLRAFYRQLAAHPGGTAEAEASRREIFAAVAITMRVRAHGEARPDAAAGEDALRRAS